MRKKCIVSMMSLLLAVGCAVGFAACNKDAPGGTDEPDEPHVHTEVSDEAVAPTCTKNGLTEGSHCAVCGEVIVAQRTVPALGHELSYHAGQAATCTQAGWNAYETCGNCGYTTYAEIPALDHNYVGGVCTRCGVADPDAQHRVAIDAIYTGIGEVRGNTVFFTLGDIPATGIGNVITADLRVYPNPAVDYVAVEGADVESITAYTSEGVLAGTCNGNRLDVSSYAPGMYILKIKADGGVKTVRLMVKR